MALADWVLMRAEHGMGVFIDDPGPLQRSVRRRTLRDEARVSEIAASVKPSGRIIRPVGSVPGADGNMKRTRPPAAGDRAKARLEKA